ncbi:MAG: hypothetical protein QM817_19370 [Archangium sp.]
MVNLLRARAPVIALLVASLVAAPSLWAGLLVDDYFHGIKLENLAPEIGGDLFSFANGDPKETSKLIVDGPYPWWAWPNLRFQFFRPLSTAVARAEHAVLGRNDVLKHLHSILWWLALVLVVNQLYRRTLEPPDADRRWLAPATTATALAMLLFALDDVHWMVVMWIANRNSLLATVPTLIGLLLHLRAREDQKGHVWYALPFFALGLSAGETAIGALAYLGAYELFGARDGWKARAKALLPVSLLGVGYVITYKLTESGAAGSGIYLDPLRDPIGFVTAAPGRMLALIGAQFLGIASDLWLAVIASRPYLVALGILAVALTGWLLRAIWPRLPDEQRRHVKWLIAGAVMSLLPVVATFPLNRLLLMPSIGGAAVIAVIFTHADRTITSQKWAVRLLILTNVIHAPVGWAASYVVGGILAKGQVTSALETPITDEAFSKRVVLFSAPDPALALYPPLVRLWFGKPRSVAWLVFSMAPRAHRITRTGPSTIELEVIDGRMLETVFERLVRSETLPVPVGFTAKINHATVKVVELDRELPRRISIEFEDIDSPEWTFVEWHDGKFIPLVLPALGQSRDLPLEAGIAPSQ